MKIADAAVLVRDGKVLISDGPFTETKEQIGGYSCERPTPPAYPEARVRRLLELAGVAIAA
jgi:hypothetical protein